MTTIAGITKYSITLFPPFGDNYSDLKTIFNIAFLPQKVTLWLKKKGKNA